MRFSHSSSVLIADDEPGIRLALQANFARQGWRVEMAAGVREAMCLLERFSFDLIVSDVRMPDGDGFELLEAVRSNKAETGFIFLTAFGTVPQAVRAMQDGAVDYMIKPVSFAQLETTAAKIMSPKAVRDTSQAAPSGIVGRSRTLLRTIERARAAAQTDADVLIEAESGTGKELLARLVHEESARSGKPFVAINCAALPEALLESELFGHARGAFTGAVAAKPGKFQIADGGTLLLDEIGEMPLNLQPKLLRALQEREVERLGETRPVRFDIRVIATTNAQLALNVEKGLFRSDLYYRLNVIPLSLTPLRERPEDIPLLARHFADNFAQKLGKAPVVLQPSFLERLCTHSWPGNVRELGNFMRRLLSLQPGADLTASSFDAELRLSSGKPAMFLPAISMSPVRQETSGPITQTVERSTLSMNQVERLHLERTLELTRGNRTMAAEMLGISLRTVRNKIRLYDLPARSYA